MQDNSFYYDPDEGVEDISSSSVPHRTAPPRQYRPQQRSSQGPIANYGNGIFKNLGNIIKTISFLLAFAILAVSFMLAFFLYSNDAIFLAVSIGIVIFGIVFATITMFLVYGIGHIICQNNEILRRMKEQNY